VKKINKQANEHHTSSGKKMSLVILGTEWNRTDLNDQGQRLNWENHCWWTDSAV